MKQSPLQELLDRTLHHLESIYGEVELSETLETIAQRLVQKMGLKLASKYNRFHL